MRYFIELAYNGTRFKGWQIQPGVPTVQEAVEYALSIKLQTTIAVTGAGRTDTGVHASFFVAHFDTLVLFSPERIIHSLNHLIGLDIVVYKIYEVHDNLHARFDAKLRTYQYKISPLKNPFLQETTLFFDKKLDFDAMNRACTILFRHSDFTSFSKLHTDVKTNNCKVSRAEWKQDDALWVFTISADRFLRNMVRAIVGTLIELGLGKISEQQFEDIILAKDRGKAGTSAPAHGLSLVDIVY